MSAELIGARIASSGALLMLTALCLIGPNTCGTSGQRRFLHLSSATFVAGLLIIIWSLK